MYFKRLEIFGFKSFLNRTKLKFEPGVTAIVGPNGCGKSNIVDAIKWVLGEQSVKSMRSAAMQDVIFNGTDRQEAVNVAEVSLTLSNKDRTLPVDYDEVTISRKLYRSGESEYILNKIPVRLTDIRALLMGTGIGTTSYSIVEQGRMDMILSSKPEERRYVFEEASGITRYKAQKRESLLKLDRTKENLLRINDIVHEVERQIRSIERKARKAERYKVRYDELKDLEIKFALKKIKELNSSDNSLGSSADGMKDHSMALSAQTEEFAVSLRKLKDEFNEVFNALQASQNEITCLSSEIDKNKHVKEVNIDRIQELQKHVERLDWEIEEAIGRKAELKNRVSSLEVRFSDISLRRQEKSSELAIAEERVADLSMNIEKHRHELKFNREKTVDIVSEETKIKNKSIRISADIQNILARQKRLKLEKNNVEQECENVSEELKSTDAKAETMGRELEAQKEEFRTFNNEYTSKQQELSALDGKKRGIERRLNEIKPRRQFLEKLLLEREGINRSVKEVMKHVDSGDSRFAGVCGILSELINVREEYEESIRAVLGNVEQALVVEDLRVVDRVTKFLGENSMESLDFIILDELNELSDKAVQSGKNTLDDISRILITREPYSSALRTLLRDTFVAVSSDSARMFMNENVDFEGCIIGKKGETYRKGIRRSRNYSDKEAIPLFGRRDKIDRMKLEEGRIVSEVEKIDDDILEIRKWLNESERKKENLEANLRKIQMDFADASSKKAVVREKFNSLSKEVLLLSSEVEEEKETVENLQTEKKQLELRLEELKNENDRMQQTVDMAQTIIQDSSRKRDEMLFSMADVKAALSSFAKEEENLAENLGRDKESFQRIEREVEEKRQIISESGDRIKQLTEEIGKVEDRNIECASRLDIKSQSIAEQKQLKNDIEEKICDVEAGMRDRQQELEALRDKMRDQDIQKKELEYKKEALVTRILDAYKVNISTAKIDIDEDVNWEETTTRINDLKDQLEKMGDVSLGAVEEYEELKERFQFLSKQRDDLVNGREALMKAIVKINRTTRKMFMESFEKIKKEFNDYFRMLFNGGKAELVLQDESDCLECGIDIIVRPPGKKLHNVMQLSGGEKAMTAIALIFAIFKVNPSPFCILDEIDAPLDESNIVRFCRVLQEFLKLSQFIVITHNRMTIQLADVLYGITMEEKGVSKIVSVKFSEETESVEKEPIPASV